MEYQDYYKTLGVPRSATPEELKKAYRALARKYHPDVNPGNAEAERQFKAVNEAYEVLSNPETRQQYDQLGANWQQQSQGGQRRQQQPDEDFGDFGGGFSDFFRTFFGGGFTQGNGGGGGGTRHRPGDLRATLNISLADAYTGGSKVVGLEGQQFSLNLKPGLTDGQKLRIKGKGRSGPDGTPGDLYLHIKVADEPGYERRGHDLYQDVQVPLYEAVLGLPLTVKTLAGPLKVNLKPGTQPGAVLRLKGKGMPVYNKAPQQGDLYLRLHILLPTDLSDREKALFTELKNIRRS